MAPNDRLERRAQRMRGTGPTGVNANFAFSFGPAPILQPQRSSRRTPQPKSAKENGLPPSASRKTPDTASRITNGSAKRHRSASAPMGSSSKPLRAVPELTTPQLGKRKRGDNHAQRADEDDGEPDQLSPENEREDRGSVEKSRKATHAPLSSIDEVVMGLEELDELSPLNDNIAMLGSMQQLGDDVSQLSLSQATPVPARPHPSKPVEPSPHTPAIRLQEPPGRHQAPSTTRTSASLPQPGDADVDMEDELSPLREDAIISSVRPAHSTPRNLEVEDPEMDDELSPEISTPAIAQSVRFAKTKQRLSPVATERHSISKAQPAAGSTTRPVVQDKRDDRSAQGKPIHTLRRTPIRTPIPSEEPVQDEDIDELSPDVGRTKPRTAGHSKKNVMELSTAEDKSDHDEEDVVEEEPLPTPPEIRRKPLRQSVRTKPFAKSATSAKVAKDEPPKKRQKRGPAEKIHTMRIKGFSVKGVSVVDTTKTIVEQLIQELKDNIKQKLQNANPSRGKDLMRKMNRILAFKEVLDANMMELQDANDALTWCTSELKAQKRGNNVKHVELTSLQNEIHDILMQGDELEEDYTRKRDAFMANKNLSQSIYDIQAAISAGKEKAEAEGRQDEGPDIPLKMRLENMARSVGSGMGGLLTLVRDFNGVMERTAGYLEGRVA